MVGKLGLAPIEPGSTYMEGATGPRKGALLLFGGNTRAKLSQSELEAWLVQLEGHLDLYFGMQVLEDASMQLAKESREIQTVPRLNDT